MIATYHNHTSWSDGKASLSEMHAWARDNGVHELGFSDHFVLHPAGKTPGWSMPPDRLGDYVGEVTSLRSQPGPVVRLGLEVDWFPDHRDAIADAIGGYPFDYLIGAIHEVNGFRIDSTAAVWERLTRDEQNDKHREYWICQRSLAESGLFDIAAHLDLPKKFGNRPTADLTNEIDAALDAIAAAGMVVEMNTAGWHKPCRDGYPSLDILERCHARDIPVTLSADAHQPDHLTRDFARGMQRLGKAGYDRVAQFAERSVTFQGLEEAVARF
jgi:histidinol-phosphatase (PHP family)